MNKIFEIEEDKVESPAVLKVLKQIDTHAVSTNNRLGSIETKIDNVCKAFPEGDFEGHRRYHATMIEMLNERRRLRTTIQEKTIGGLVWLAIMGVGAAVWHEIARAISGTK